MAKLTIVVAHHLTQDEAGVRIKALLDELKNKYASTISDLREEWSADAGKFSFSTMGFAVSGELAIKPARIELNGNLPFAAMLLRGKIESIIREKVDKALA